MKSLFVLLLFLATSVDAAPRKFILEFRAGVTAQALETLREDAPRLRVRHEFRRAFHGIAVELAEGESYEALERLPYVARVHPDIEVRAHASGQATLRTTRRAVGRNGTGTGIVVAVIDTGIDHTHPALAGKYLGGWDFVNDDGDPMDDNRHGTHVAGIIAAEGPEITGVAPGVKLLAYKVLNNTGNGNASDIVAAIERAMDPNRDGNTSDRADVINLSLGGPGTPGDPMSQAVERAVAAGIVVCASAGNDGEFHRIGSPAGAPSAITVGATAQSGATTIVADFSSRGPATRSGAIKPDLLAPGAGILSTGLGHKLIVLSGTSMASPYVAGLAALLLEEHPDWTPARVKSALAATALPVGAEEAMTQGSGAADIERAIANDISVIPAQLNFGLDGQKTPSFQAVRRIQIRNEGSAPRTFHITPDSTHEAIAMTIAPAEVTLAAGESRPVDVTIDVDHAKLGVPATGSISFSGTLLLETDGDPLRIPWAFIRAGRVLVTYDGLVPQVAWSSATPGYASVSPIGFGIEALLAPGTYDFAVVATEENGDTRVIVAEERQVEGDVTLALSAASAPHRVWLEGLDERGVPFVNGNGTTTLSSVFARLLLRNSGSIPLPKLGTLHASSFSSNFALLATRAFVDVTARRVVIAQYPEQRGLAGNAVLRVTPPDYALQEVRFHFPAGATHRQVTVAPRDWPRNPGEFAATAPPQVTAVLPSNEWRATLAMTAEPHADYASGVQFATAIDASPLTLPDLITPMVRRNADGFFAMRGFDETSLPVGAVAGEAIEFGAAPLVPLTEFRATQTSFTGILDFLGPRNEVWRRLSLGMTYRITNAAGVETASGTIDSGRFSPEISGDGPFHAELRLGQSTLRAVFNRSTTLPAFTSFAILDGEGRHTTRLVRNGNGMLVFSAADAVQAGVFFRRYGALTWVQLTAVATADEELLGTIYRVDLADALRIGGDLELLVELLDANGDALAWHLVPAMSTAEVGVKRRAVR